MSFPNFPNGLSLFPYGGQFSECAFLTFLISLMNFPNFLNLASNFRIYQPKLGQDLFVGLTPNFPNIWGSIFWKAVNFPNGRQFSKRNFQIYQMNFPNLQKFPNEHWEFSEFFQSNFRIWRSFPNLFQLAESLPNFRIVSQISEFGPKNDREPGSPFFATMMACLIIFGGLIMHCGWRRG